MARPKQVYAQVIKDLRAREKFGIDKYGVSVDKAQLDSLKWMQHAYEESLGHAIYMKKLMLQYSREIEANTVQTSHLKIEEDKNQLKLFGDENN